MPERKYGGRREVPLENVGNRGAIRGLALRRRRSRVPWIYLVYHDRLRAPAPADVTAARCEVAGLATRAPPKLERVRTWRTCPFMTTLDFERSDI